MAFKNRVCNNFILATGREIRPNTLIFRKNRLCVPSDKKTL
nr:MAG TPA: hypothetical protein [Caudoviricetes sp.]